MMHATLVIRRAAQAAAFGFLLTVMAGTPAAAQTSVFATIGGTLDGLRAVASPAETTNNVAANAIVEHEFNDRHGRVYYDFDTGTYSSPGDWSYFLHTAGFTYTLGDLDTVGRRVYVNGSFTLRRNGDAWAGADYSSAGAGLNAEFHPRQNSTLRTGYRLDYRNFADYSALTQLEHRLFGSALVNFESRTTLVAEVQAGMKGYEGWVYTEVPAPVVTEPVATGSRGRGMGSGIRVTAPTSTFTAESNRDRAGMVIGLARVAQSITDRTGIHAQVSLRHIMGSVPPALVTTPAGFFEDGVYDDPYASKGLFAQVGLKRVFAGGSEIEALGWWADKDYVSDVALDGDGLDLPGSPLRTDRVWLASAAWSQPLLADRLGAVELSLEVRYRYTHHTSNDAFYNYTSHAAGVGFTIGY